MKRRGAIAIGLVIALGLGVFGVARGCHQEKPLSPEDERSANAHENALRGPSDPVDPTSSEVRPRDGESASPLLDRKRREEMRQAIYRAWGVSAPTSDYRGNVRPPPPPSPEEARPFDKDYIRSRIREDYVPLAKDCYEKGLKKNPKLEGKLTASFRIVGNKNVGGIIDWVDASTDTTLGDKDVIDCLEQSLYSVSFQAPPNDGIVTVTYPLTFSPDAPDASED